MVRTFWKKIGLALVGGLVLSGCQVTSGQLRSKAVPCFNVDTDSDFRGSKPQWNTFGKVTGIEYCRASGQRQHKFALENGRASSQIASSDTVAFHEISERVFRELLFNSKEARSQADSIKVKQLDNDGRPTFYTLLGGPKDASVFFVMNDGYPGEEPLYWSQIHMGLVRSPTGMSAEVFETQFIRKIRGFKNTGGNYSYAYTERPETSTASTNTSVQSQGWSSHSGALNMSVFGRWAGVSDNFKGYMTASTRTQKGSIVISLPDQNDRCFGIWSVTGGKFGTDLPPKGVWSIDCESKKSASGEFISEKLGHGLGEGRDSDDHSITFYYKQEPD